jgi:hypothetical protein
MSVRFLSTACLAFSVGLAAGCAPRAGRPPATPDGAVSTPPDGAQQPGVETAGAEATSSGAPSSPIAPERLPGGEEPTPDKALPELKIEPIGMHVGGGKNTPDEKAPFHRALERQFPALLTCYRLVDDPWSGGSFGVDLKIPRAGGAPTVEQPRTKIRGNGFEPCMLSAFAQTHFEKPKAGPTVISYSVRFSLGSGKK